jgi:hypothetical protein
VLILQGSLTPLRAGPGCPCAPHRDAGTNFPHVADARITTESKVAMTLIAVRAVVLTSAVAPASDARGTWDGEMLQSRLVSPV